MDMFTDFYLQRLGIFVILHLGIMLLLYVIAQRSGRHALVDPGWSGGLGLGAVMLLEEVSFRSLCVLGVLLLWSGRLTWYLVKSRVLSGAEDNRYARMAAALGPRVRPGFLLLFLAQVLLAVLFLIPWQAAQVASDSFRLWDAAGLLLALVAILGEGIADRQLSRYRLKPRPKPAVFSEGLWRFSRHPNYFFEWLYWCSYLLLAAGSPHWGWALLGPVLMYIFLFFITGIPHLEREAVRSRGEAYLQYQKSTSRFWPWIPQKQP